MYKQHNGWKSWLLPGGILTTAALQVYILSPYVSSIGVAPIAGVGALGVILALVLAVRKQRKNSLTNYLGSRSDGCLTCDAGVLGDDTNYLWWK